MEKLIRTIVERANLEYSCILDNSLKDKEKREQSVRELEKIQKGYGISTYEQLTDFLEQKGYFYLERELLKPCQGRTGKSFLLGKIRNKGKSESEKYEYNWYIIETNKEDFTGVDVFENLNLSSRMEYCFSHCSDRGLTVNRTPLEYYLHKDLFLFSYVDDITEFQMEEIKKNLEALVGYNFFIPLVKKAKRESPDENSAKKAFIEMALDEIIKLEIFHNYPVRIDNIGLPNEEIEFKTFIKELRDFPSYHTLLLMTQYNPSTALGKGAKKVFKLLNSKGYDVEWLKNSTIEEISEVVRKITN